jgi:hypothetical protein
LAVRRRAGTQGFFLRQWTPDQQRTTPQERRAAQHPGNAVCRGNAGQKEGPHQAGLRKIGWSTDPKSDQAVLL